MDSIVFADTTLNVGDTSLVTFTFSESVAGTFSNDDITTINNGTISTVTDSGAGTIWTATFTPTASVVDSTNVITVTLSGITDLVSNAGTGTTSSANYTIDTRVNSGGGYYNVNSNTNQQVVPIPVVNIVKQITPVSTVIKNNYSNTIYIFTKTLKHNVKNIEVKKLQQFLNSKGYFVAKKGAGSPGRETITMGLATVKALKKYQKANGLKADGILGPKGRAFIMSHQ